MEKEVLITIQHQSTAEHFVNFLMTTFKVSASPPTIKKLEKVSKEFFAFYDFERFNYFEIDVQNVVLLKMFGFNREKWIPLEHKRDLSIDLRDVFEILVIDDITFITEEEE